MSNKQVFLELYSQIKREGASDLLKYLESTDFFTAPASTNFHSAYEGGLVDHSVKVYHRFLQIVKSEYGEKWQDFISHESVLIISLLHDICKANFYVLDYRNVKVNGNWERKPYFTVDDKLPYGHGEKSVYIINGFIKLTRDEAMAINWHMGAFDLRVKGGSYSLSEVFYKYPTAFLFHQADMQATYLDEEKYRKDSD